ncbi:hypothetical protein UT300005_02420 [Clostridium sp. CTA-5]
MSLIVKRAFIEGFEDERLQNGFNDYYELWEKGLKKQANKSIRETMQYFDSLNKQKKKSITYHYCKAVCEQEEYTNLYSRMFHHVDIPYEIMTRISKILKEDCDSNYMPQIRWYYEFFDKDDKIIEKAYSHQECDDRTIQLYFTSLLTKLDWGAHHFPEGCLITLDTYNKVVNKCDILLHKHRIDKPLIEDFNYYNRLYNMWWKYRESDRIKSFNEWCQNHNVEFETVPTFYYEK